MKNKGFTLIELLGVLVIISILGLISFEIIVNYKNKTDNKIDSALKTLIEQRADQYVKDKKYNIKTGNVYCITISDLTDYDYLDENLKYSNGNNIDPNIYVRVTINENNYNSEVLNDDECEEIIR